MTRARLVAVTGATGFLGRHLVAALAADGFAVRALVRRDPTSPFWRELDPEIVLGDLDDAKALRRLADGAEMVIHAAGLTKARDLDGFMRVNRDGARRVAEAVGPGRLMLISSLAAREPQLSDYAASKRAGEEAVAAVVAPERLTIVRPPAIYGPGDLEFLPLFRAAKGLLIPLLGPPEARLAMIHVEDAARMISALVLRRAARTLAISDLKPEGYSWREVAEAAARAVRGRPMIWQAPDFIAGAAGAGADLAAGLLRHPMVFSSGKTREMRHLDWTVRPFEQLQGLPEPYFDLDRGLRHTVAWATARRLF
jgi:uncharacterized protein YbjT (DUF2867 family)